MNLAIYHSYFLEKLWIITSLSGLCISWSLSLEYSSLRYCLAQLRWHPLKKVFPDHHVDSFSISLLSFTVVHNPPTYFTFVFYCLPSSPLGYRHPEVEVKSTYLLLLTAIMDIEYLLQCQTHSRWSINILSISWMSKDQCLLDLLGLFHCKAVIFNILDQIYLPELD